MNPMKYMLKYKMGLLLRTAYSGLNLLAGARGKRVFSKLIGRLAPYTATIDARVLELRPGFALIEMPYRQSVQDLMYRLSIDTRLVLLESGYARVEMRDTPDLGNPFGSLHAVALANLAMRTAEVSVQVGERFLQRPNLVQFSIDYMKKARGLQTAEFRHGLEITDRVAHLSNGVIRDSKGDLVAVSMTSWSEAETTDRVTLREPAGKEIHPAALLNLAEMATGLAFLMGMPDCSQGIITRLSISFMKKVFGPVVAECRCVVPASGQKTDYQIEASIRDENGDLVATALAQWSVSPVKP